MDRAVERLAAAGFDDTVYDEAIVKEEPGSVDPAIPTLAPRSSPEVVLGSDEPNLLPKRDKQTIVRAFKSQLADYHLPNEVIEAYATTFYHRQVCSGDDRRRARRASHEDPAGVRRHTSESA